MGALDGCKPRAEVLRGDLDDAIFAADFGDVIADAGPEVYRDPRLFFRNTHPAKQLCQVVQAVFRRLADPGEGGATIRLSTGFGGGKTHTLIALWHLARNIGDPSMGTELLPAAGRPQSVNVVAVDAGKAGTAVFSRSGGVVVKSLWGEMAYRLGGDSGLRALGPVDDPEQHPDEGLLAALFPAGPVLILLDELVVYMAALSNRGQGNVLAFLNKLAAVVSKRPQTALVVTDPADQRVYTQQTAQLNDALTQAAVKLDDLFGRKLTDFDPIGDEAARVIVRRLFEWVDPAASQAASATYHSLYKRVLADSPGLLPPAAASGEYAQRIVECYPFHPRLLDTAQNRLAALQDFQKSRGVLRLFGRLIRDIWEAQLNLELISAADVNWSSPRIQADLLQRLNRESFKGAINADVWGHALELDGGVRGVHQRAASALLLESLPLQPNSGLDRAELTLAALRPDEAGPEPAEGLDRLVGVCWHTYPMPGGRGWQFRYEPNINRLIEEQADKIDHEDAKNRVLAEVQGYFSGPAFSVAAWPASARQVQEKADLQLVLCESEEQARWVCTYGDDSDPQAPIPRLFQNAIVAIAPTPAALGAAVERARRLMAAEAIEKESRHGESSKLTREQLQRTKPELEKQFRIQTRRSFDRVVLASGGSYTIEEQYQVGDDAILQRPQGQAILRKFLEAKNLIYKQGDALDVDRFLADVLPGATPLVGQPDVYTLKAVHERFLAAPGLRLIPDGGIVRETVKRAVAAGKVVVRFADSRVYDSQGCVEGPPGMRCRTGAALTHLPLDDTVTLTPAASMPAAEWIKEDTPDYGGGGGDPGPKPPPPPPPPGGPVTVTTWDKLVELASTRSLIELRLVATRSADAAALLQLAQPLGADSLSLSVRAGGGLKDGGSVQFSAEGLKPSHPLRPLATAQTLYNAMADGAFYEAELVLKFSANGRSGLHPSLADVSSRAPAEIKVTGIFGTAEGKSE